MISRRAGLAPALLLAACATAPPSPPPPAPAVAGPFVQHDKDSFYDLNSATAGDLHAAIRKWGAANGDAEMAALTRAEFKTDLRFRQEQPDRCFLEARLTVEIETTLPRWHPPSNASDDVRQRWQNFDRAIRLHERGHYEYAQDEARELSAALQGLRVADCKDMNASAQKLNDKIAKKYQELNDEYDRKTGHGKTQGAVF